jgi:hypothetical protein
VQFANLHKVFEPSGARGFGVRGVADCAVVPRAIMLCATQASQTQGWSVRACARALVTVACREHVATPLLSLGCALLSGAASVVGTCYSAAVCAPASVKDDAALLAALLGRALLLLLFRVHEAARAALVDVVATRLMLNDPSAMQVARCACVC